MPSTVPSSSRVAMFAAAAEAKVNELEIMLDTARRSPPRSKPPPEQIRRRNRLLAIGPEAASPHAKIRGPGAELITCRPGAP